MLHELLLALSGHSSPLLSDAEGNPELRALLSPSEAALLISVAHLGNLHIQIRTIASAITKCHPSIVCRAVAQAITSIHLKKFQEEILRVERGVLHKRARFVGAYDIVPLSSVSIAFSGWRSKLEWLKNLVQQIQPSNTNTSGAQVIDWLQKELQTGFPDVGLLVLNLVQVAEAAWLRQISAWLLYGTLPALGAKDFLIQRKSSSPTGQEWSYIVVHDLAPGYVTQATASSILFIGKSLEYVRQDSYSRDLVAPDLIMGQTSLVSAHLERLSTLKHPIGSTSLTQTIMAIRSSLSQNVLRRLLPLSEVLRAVTMLHDYFLLERGEFAVALVAAAGECLSAKQNRSISGLTRRDTYRLGGMMVKEGEVSAVLARTWTAMATLQDVDDDIVAENLELARSLLCLSMKKYGATQTCFSFTAALGPLHILKNDRTTFDNMLLATPTYLTLIAGPPLHLFLHTGEADAYSSIHSYLLAIRRAHLHLTGLWKLNTLRKQPSSYNRGFNSNGHSKQNHEKSNKRERSLRRVWALVGSVVFFFAELGEYLQGEVVKNSRNVFIEWLKPSQSTKPTKKCDSFEECGSIRTSVKIQGAEAITHDPESLTLAHRCYLTFLIHSLLLDDLVYTKSLKTLMIRVDYITALVERLSIVQLNLSIADSYGGVSATVVAEEEELTDLAQSSIGIEDDLQKVVRRLRDINFERLGPGTEPMTDEFQSISFVPWNAQGLYRLLVKLDFAGLRVVDENRL
ncbi:hypothetical protein MMC34_008532 [Xylographa carneopallida]|nr:hypothetical protein [Xylographa carneopallida]